MECPRCGATLLEYALGGRESRAVVCESCGYADVPADHHAEPADAETWEAALERFRAEHADREPEGETRPPVELDIGGTTYRVTPGLAERFADLTGKQRAILRELLAEPDPMAPDRTRAEIADAAGVHPSYVGDVVREHGDVAAALAASEVVETDAPEL